MADTREQVKQKSSAEQQGTSQAVSTREQPGALQGTAPGQGERSLSMYRDPFALMQRLSQEMDELFDSFFYGRPAGRQTRDGGLRSLWAPDVEVCEEQNQLRVLIDLPGVSRDNVKVDVHDEGITVQGERREERTEGGEQQGYRRSERRYGSFYRTIPLPEGAKTEEAKAQMKDGVLEVIVPIPERSRPRRLEIQG
jgi:HSP20 family protein